MSLKKKAISGVKWTTVATFTLAISALLKISLLTRFLDKEDFGLMALVTFVMGFMNLFMDMGLSSAILHKQNITRNEYASLFWLNVFFGLVFFLLVLSVSPFIALFYEEVELSKLIPLMGLGIIFSSFGRQYKTILQKEIRFKIIAIVEIIAAFFSFTVAIVLALKNYGVYTLVFSALCQYFIANLVFFIIGNKNQKLLFHFNYSQTKPFLKIGVFQVGGQIINYFNRDIDILIIGKFFGTDVLGGYSLAKQLVRRPLSVLDPIVVKVANSILPRYQNDNYVLLKYFIKIIRGFSVINAIVYGTIVIAAPLIVTILYGADYLGIVNIVRILAILIYFRSISGIVTILSITKGRTDLEFYWNIFTLIIFPIAIFIGINYGVLEIAAIIACAQIFLMLPSWYLFYYRLIGMKLLIYMKIVCYPFLIAVGLFLLYYILKVPTTLIQISISALLAIILGLYAFFTIEEINIFLKTKYKKYVRFFTGDRDYR